MFPHMREKLYKGSSGEAWGRLDGLKENFIFVRHPFEKIVSVMHMKGMAKGLHKRLKKCESCEN